MPRPRAKVSLEQRSEPAHQKKVVQKRAFRRDEAARRQFLGTHKSNVKATERLASEAESEVPDPEKLLKGTACHARVAPSSVTYISMVRRCMRKPRGPVILFRAPSQNSAWKAESALPEIVGIESCRYIRSARAARGPLCSSWRREK